MDEYPPIISPDDLRVLYPDVPFTDQQLDTATANLRQYAGWHVAPALEDTITVEALGGERSLTLPTLHIVSVSEVRRRTGGEWRPISARDYVAATSQRASAIWAGARCGWQRGLYQVDLVHGYSPVPANLLAALVTLSNPRPGPADIASETLPGHSVTFRAGGTLSRTLDALVSSGALDAYRLPPRP